MESRDGGREGRGEVGEIQAFFITTLSLSFVHTQGAYHQDPYVCGDACVWTGYWVPVTMPPDVGYLGT